MAIIVSETPLRNLLQIAKTNAIAGASAGVAMGVIQGMVSVRQSRLQDRYDVAAEGLTYVGTGAILGALAATVTALAGVSVAAIAGRGILSIAVPLVASTVATGSAHKPTERLVRSWSEDAVNRLKWSLERHGQPKIGADS